MRHLYCTALLISAVAWPAVAQPLATPGSRGYTVFLRGVPVGREEVTVRQDADGVVIAGESRFAPLNISKRHTEVRYRTDGTPEWLEIEAIINGADIRLRTTFKDGMAVTEGTNAGAPISAADATSPRPVVLPALFFGAYEAIGRRLMGAAGGEQLQAYIGGPRELALVVKSVTTDRMQAGTSTFNVRRYVLAAADDAATVSDLSVDDSGTLVRLVLPAQSLDVVRDDMVSSTSRTKVYTNPGDEAVIIPSSGFNIGATLTHPVNTVEKVPVVVFVGGSSLQDREGYVAAVPIFGQMAGALAEAGFLAVRYDKRGSGQSGGRPESVTLQDFAEDARAVVKWLSSRRDIDSRRIVLVGYDDGAWVALLAAARDKRVAGVVTIAAPSLPGGELVLEQQERVLNRSSMTETERAAKIELQKRIHAAVLTGRGWEGVPPELRKQADTPLFQSILAFDPVRVLDDVRQPLLVVHGELDQEVPVAHARRLADTAQRARKGRAVDVVAVAGVNHMLTAVGGGRPAAPGRPSEYPVEYETTVSRGVITPIAEWLRKTLAAK